MSIQVFTIRNDTLLQEFLTDHNVNDLQHVTLLTNAGVEKLIADLQAATSEHGLVAVVTNLDQDTLYVGGS